MTDLLHSRYLPFTADQLKDRFIAVAGARIPAAAADGDDPHLRYYLTSIRNWNKYRDDPESLQVGLGRQMEKDERFWVATALMTLFYADNSAEAFGALLERAGLRPPPGYGRWADALTGPVDLFLEVNLPSPHDYREWLRANLDERVPIPYLKERAAEPGSKLEGQTHADALLIAYDSGAAIIFEAKVLSDVSTSVTFDLARNQLARTIDVMLEDYHDKADLDARLRSRKPDLSYVVLLTPAVMQPQGSTHAVGKSRLYGWLMPEYRDHASGLLRQHLPHRSQRELAGAADRLGWTSWEDCQDIVPGACPWLGPPSPQINSPKSA
jgi:hypothetical protein